MTEQSENKVLTDAVAQNTDERHTHSWRCMNCNKMTYSYICNHCGKESYNKTALDDEREKRLAEKATVTESTPQKAKEKTTPSINKKDLNSLADKININLSATGKSIKAILCTVIVLFVVLSAVVIVKYNGIEKHITDLETANSQLSALVSSQAETTKQIEENTAKVPEIKTENTLPYIVHTVKSGETLDEICTKYNIDFYINKNLILSINGLESGDIIQPEQKIMLPRFDNK